jgi:uncharacterized protein YqhQ
MALRNGLLIHGPTSWAAAARAANGEIEVASGPKPVFAKGRLGTTPLVRGPLRLAEAIAVLPVARRNLPSARLPFEDRRVIAVALATTAASGLLRRRRARGAGGSLAREGLLSALGSLPALAALRDRDLAAYHGVEHKAIGAYEQGAEDPAAIPKEHDRCGSNLIAPLLAFSAAGQLIVDRVVAEPRQAHRALAGLGAASAAVEVFALADRKPNSAIGRAVHGPGHEIQRLVSTREPTPEQLEVGRAALAAILAEEAKHESGTDAGLQAERADADTV